MTLIVGIKCQDGVVLGADGAATLGPLGQPTVRQVSRKLQIVSGSCVVGVSGPVGLHQRITDEIEKLWDAKAFASATPGGAPITSAEAMVKITDSLRRHVMAELQAAAGVVNLLGPNAAVQSAISYTVIALPLRRTPCLFQFGPTGAPEEARNDLPFVAIGSGQFIADPFLAFIRRLFWQDTLPNVNQGTFAIAWTIHHAIKTNPGGISEPIQIVVLEDRSGQCRARELSPEELEEHFTAIEKIEEHIAAFPTGKAQEPPRP